MPKKGKDPTDAYVGSRVRMRRMLLGMSQERLGELLDLTFQQVQKYEKGVNRIGAGRLFEVARILGVQIDYFFEGLEGARSAGSKPEPLDTSAILDSDVLRLAFRINAVRERVARTQMLSIVGATVKAFERPAQNDNPIATAAE